MKKGLFMDKGRELMGLSMKWGGFMEREQGAKERRSEEAKKGGGRRVAGKMLRRGKGRGMWFEEERFLKMWNRMYIYIRPSQDKKKEEEKKQQKKPQKKKEEEKKTQRKRRI